MGPFGGGEEAVGENIEGPVWGKGAWGDPSLGVPLLRPQSNWGDPSVYHINPDPNPKARILSEMQHCEGLNGSHPACKPNLKPNRSRTQLPILAPSQLRRTLLQLPYPNTNPNLGAAS